MTGKPEQVSLAESKPQPDRKRAGRVIAVACAAFSVGMVGAAYASVPLYELFCQVTGYGGTTQRAEANASTIVDKEITVRFDANASKEVPWSFRPNDREVRLNLGETRQTSYHVKNDSDRAVTARATFNVTPDSAGVYFNKIQCFCFTDQTLAPGEEVDMPIVFYVDPDIADSEELRDLPAITLSYTFFAADVQPEPVAEAPADPAEKDQTDRL